MIIDAQAKIAQHLEEAFGMADPGQGVAGLADEPRQRPACAIQQIDRIAGHEAHAPVRHGLGYFNTRIALDDHGIHLGQALRGFAQGPRRQAAAIAQATGAIDHGDLDVARQLQVLQAVVQQQHIGAKLHRLPSGECALRMDDHLDLAQTALEQQRFVAHLGGAIFGANTTRLALDPGAVAPADDGGMPALGLEATGQPVREGVLPLPPTVTLPITMTGTGRRSEGLRPER